MPAPVKVLRGGQWGEALADLLAASPESAAAWMERHCELLKRDDYSRVGLLPLDGQPCYLKLYLAKSAWQKLGYRLGYGRGLRSFDAALALLSEGLAVPRPRSCVLVAEGILLLTEAIAGGRDLRALWGQLTPQAAPERLLGAAGDALAALHAAGFSHGDAKWSNLLWTGSRFYLVDLEAVRRCRAPASGRPHPRQLKDLARFTIDAEELGASEGQFEAFLAAYLERAACGREQLICSLGPLLPPIRERHRRRYGTQPRPLV